MKRHYFNSLFPVVALLLVLMGGVVSCGTHSKERDIVDISSDAISDSLKAGRLSGVGSVIDREMLQASDSDTYYTWLMQKAVLGYYAAQPDSILVSSSRVLAYLDRVEPTGLRWKIRSKVCQARAGYFNQFVYDADSALFYQQSGYEAARKSGDKELTQLALANLADCHRLSGRLDKAADCYREAIAMADSLGLSGYGVIPVYSGLAAVYTGLYEFEQSDIWWNRVDSLYEEMPPSEKFYYLNNRGNDLYLAEKYERSLEYFMRLSEMLKDQPDMEWERRFCSANLSDVLLKLGRGEEAKAYIDDNLKYFSETQPNEYAYNHILIQKMELLSREGRDEEVVNLLRLNPTDKSKRQAVYFDRYQFLKDFYPKMGQWERAYNALSSYRAIDDSLRNDRRRLSAAEQELRYRRDSEVLGLRFDVERQRDKIMRTYLIAMGIALVAAVLALVLIIMRRHTRLREERMLNRIMRLRIESVRSGVTPHFIYNALNQELYAREQGLPGNLGSLSSLLRRQQMMAANLTSTLKDELEFAEDYVAVERSNVREGLNYEVVIGEGVDTETVRLPSMSIQILVENAFKHGLLRMGQGEEAMLRISAERKCGEVTVAVMNTLPSSSGVNVPSTKVGLKVIMATMQLLNEHNRQKMRLSVAPWNDTSGRKGYKAEIIIPLNFNYDINGNDD